MRKYIFLSLHIVTVIACSDNITNITINKPNFKEFITVPYDSICINEIIDIMSWKADNNKVYIFSPMSTDAFLFVYSFPQFDFLYKYGERGRGPNEFISVNWGNTKSDDEIILYDIMNRKLYSFISNDSICFIKQSFDLHGESESDILCKPFTMINRLNDSLFMMKVDSPDESYIEIVDLSKRKEISKLDSHLKRPEKSAYTPFDFILESYNKTVISVFRFMDRIEISNINEEFHIIPRIIINNGSDQSELKDYNDLKMYYTDVIFDGKCIYTVNQNGKNYEKSSIEIYNLDGTSRGLLLLDQYVELILLSSDSKTIYAYKPLLGSNIVYIYNVPDELASGSG